MATSTNSKEPLASSPFSPNHQEPDATAVLSNYPQKVKYFFKQRLLQASLLQASLLQANLLQASLFSGLITTLALTLTGSPATAATFIFDSTALAGNTTVGNHEAITTTFDTTTDLFTWSVTLSRNTANNRLADGGWLVVNASGNPRADNHESVIFYLDSEAGQVSAYNYSGQHRSHSWRTSNFLGATALTVNNAGNERTLSFAFDMSQINRMTDTFGPEWKGTAFGEQVGIWFHGVDGLMTGYTDNGNLTEFSYTHQGWYDTKAKQTVVAPVLSSAQDIPEPSALITLGLLASVLMVKSRDMNASCDDSASAA